jgi:hypothetical protein
VRWHGNPDAEDAASPERLPDLLTVVQQHELDLLDSPRRRGDRRNVQALIDLGASRIVDPRDHLGDVIVLERDPSGHDVGVVARRDGDERVRVLHARLVEDVAVEAKTDDLAGVIAGRIAVERLRILVDDDDVVAALAERV